MPPRTPVVVIPDVLVQPRWLARAVRALDARPRIALMVFALATRRERRWTKGGWPL